MHALATIRALDKDAIREENRKLLSSVKEASKVLNIGLTLTNELVRSGQLKSVKLGKRRLIVTQSINDLITAQLATAN